MISYQVPIYRLSAIGYNIEILVLCCYSYTISSSPYSTIVVQYHWPVNMAVDNLWSRVAKRFLTLYDGGLYECLFDAYIRIKFWKNSSSSVLLKL